MAADKRAKNKGRKSKSGRFVMLPMAVFESPACATLTHAHFRLLMALAADYNGNNNGALALTRPQARQLGIGSNRTMGSGFRELEQRGLIIKTDPGMLRPPRPARYAITWKATDKTSFTDQVAANHGYKNWEPGSEKLNVDAYSGCPDGPTEDARKVVYLDSRAY